MSTGAYVGIPTSYTPVEYIESTGTQYIDTGIYPNSSIHCYVDFQMSSIPTSSEIVAGAWEGSKGMLFGVHVANGLTNFEFAFGTGAWGGNTQTADTNRHTVYMNDENGDGRLDNTVLASHTNVSSLTNTTYKIYLFRCNGSVTYYSKCKIYSCKIYNGSTLVRDYAPALDENNVACFYEKVEGKYYYNAGTGTFNYGTVGQPVVVGDFARKIKKMYVGIPTYTPVEYIESSGTQYIETGITQSGYHSVFDVSFSSFPSLQIITGSYGPSDNQRFYTRVNADGTLVTQFGGYSGNNLITGPTLTLNNRYVINSKLFNGTQSLIVNDTTYGTRTISGQTFPSGAKLYLLANWDGSQSGAATGLASCKIYSAKYYDISGTLLRDFVPVLDSNNVACLFDLVEGKFYYNKGTGTFTAGSTTSEAVSLARKVKKGYVGVTSTYTPVEYIESSGTQYINTGVPPKPTTKLEFDANIVSGDNNVWLGVWGSRTTATSDYFCLYAQTSSPHYLSPNYAGFDPGTSGNTPINFNQRYVLTQDKGQFYIDGVKATALSTTNTLVAGTQPIYLFTNNSLGTPQMRGQDVKLYGCKITEGDTLVRNFIPVVDQDNVACLYDLVEGKFYYNKGTGTFTVGSTTGEPVVVGSRARLCYYGVPIRKISSVPDLSVARFYMGFAWTGKYAVFAGGTTHANSSGTHKNTVDAYDSSNFTRSTATAIDTAANRLGSAHIGDYAIFAGGTNYNSAQNQVNAYSSTLVKTRPTTLSFYPAQTGGATVSNTYALITGGNTNVNAYNASLTRTNLGSIVANKERWNMMTPVGDYVVMPGGYAYPTGGTNTVEVINSSLVKSTATNLANNYSSGAVATSNSKFAIVAQGLNVEAFDDNLVKYSSSLSTARTGLGGAGNKDMALIAGGSGSNVVDIFDISLVRYPADPLTTSRGNLCGTVVNNYAFFAGGGVNNSPLASADAYELS